MFKLLLKNHLNQKSKLKIQIPTNVIHYIITHTPHVELGKSRSLNA